MTLRQFLSAFALFGLVALASAQPKGPLKIGVTSYTSGAIEVAAAVAKKQGLDVRVIEFGDWTTPNAALDAGDLDLNFFQHQAFLDASIKQRGYKLKSVAVGVLSTFSLASTKVKRLEDIKNGATFGIHNDPSNQARALRLLERVGFIRLREGAGNWATLADVVENPRKIKFVEIEGTQIVRSLDDLDFAATSPFTLVLAGKSELANNALAYTQGDDVYYAGQFVTRLDNAADPRIQQFIRIYHEDPAVRKELHANFANNDKLYSLPWLRK